MNIRNTSSFDKVLYFKFFMVIVVWGLLPLFIPQDLLPFLGLREVTHTRVLLIRVWGVIVLLDSFVYVYIFKHRNRWLTKYLLLFSIIDNAGIAILILIATPIFSLPWGAWIHTPFQLFFGYWFWRFYTAGQFERRNASRIA